MRKIFCIVLFILIPFNVFAEEANKQYKFYYIEKDYSKEFYEKGANPKEYPFINDIWKYSDEIKVSFEKPTDEENIIKEVPVIKYQEQEKVRYIIIDQTYSNTKFNLQEIEVYNKDDKIEYFINCSTCSSDFFSLIQNTRKDYEYNYINNNTKMIIDLKKEYFPNDLTIKLYLNGAIGKTAKYRVTVNNTNNLSDVYYRYTTEVSLSSSKESSKKLKDVEHEERYNEEIKEIKDTIETTNIQIVDEYKEYHYKVKLYQYYNETKHYVDGYYYDLPGLIKDEDNYVETIQTENVIESEQEEPEILQDQHEKEVETEQQEEIKIEYLTKEVFVPIIQEKIKYQEKEIKVEVPKEVETVVEKEVIKKEEQNYLLSYSFYLFFTLVTRKMYKTFN